MEDYDYLVQNSLSLVNEIGDLDSPDILIVNGGASLHSVGYSVVDDFIRVSAYWDHPKSGWVNAPKHAERIQAGDNGYEIQFGGNYFLVEVAIQRCSNFLTEILELISKNEPYSYNKMVSGLTNHILGAVANTSGDEYSGYYPKNGNLMVFGTQGIFIDGFIDHLFDLCEVKPLFELFDE